MQLQDYFVIYTPLKFYANETDCADAFDGDVAGRGVSNALRTKKNIYI